MARIVDNDDGYKTIAVTFEEAQKLGLGYVDGCVCIQCNKVMDEYEETYYICMLNNTMCKECAEKYLEQERKLYLEDVPGEDRIFKHYCKLLNLDYD